MKNWIAYTSIGAAALAGFAFAVVRIAKATMGGAFLTNTVPLQGPFNAGDVVTLHTQPADNLALTYTINAKLTAGQGSSAAGVITASNDPGRVVGTTISFLQANLF